MDTRFINNHVELIGKVVSDAEYNHEVFKEKMYRVYLSTERKSGVADVIPIIIPEFLRTPDEIKRGSTLRIEGQYRSFNKHDNTGTHLILSVHAVDIEELDDNHKHMNRITLDGYICKLPTYRETPYGRQISDFIVAANRPYGKSDYIPCLAWGRSAKRISGYEVGTHVSLTGRIQSREYQKKISETEFEAKVAYEVSTTGVDIKQESEELAE